MSAALANLSNAKHLFRTTAYINGAWVQKCGTRKTFEVYNPFSSQLIANVQEVNGQDVTESISHAADAFQKWKVSSCKERSNLLRKLFTEVTTNHKELATIAALESGKSIKECLAEVRYGASFLEWFAEESKRSYGDILPNAEPNIRRYVIKQPIGVAGLITPWNFPISMITRKLGAALAAGCTVVLKPAEDTPLTALAICKLIEDVGFPPGVVNVLPCSRDMASVVGGILCDHTDVRTVSFTGSTAVGKKLMEQCAKTVKRISMELGGGAPFIVFNSADVDVAVKAAIISKFRNNGQACVAADRFLIQNEIYDAFVEKFRDAARQLIVGDPLDPNTDMGTLINQKALRKVKNHVSDAIEKGAKVVLGGKFEEGLIYRPTILTNCTPLMDVVKMETFGPIAPVVRFKDEKDAIELANDTTAGLAAYLCTSDYRQQVRVGEKLDFGIIGVNEGLLSYDSAPFGGMKESGIGREGSKYGIDEYLEMKYICLGGMEP